MSATVLLFLFFTYRLIIDLFCTDEVFFSPLALFFFFKISFTLHFFFFFFFFFPR